MGIIELTTDLLNAVSIFINSGLFFDELKHGLVSSIYALVFYLKFKNIKLSLAIVFMTYLIDIDHLVDYFLFYGSDFSFSRFIKLEYFAIAKRAVVPFHAWEWAIFAFMLSTLHKYKNYKKYLVALGTGIVAHLTWDSITVGSVIFYSIIYRISHGFIVIT